MAYLDDGQVLRLAYCSDASCSSATTVALQSGGNLEYVSLALLDEDRPAIAFSAIGVPQLQYISCADAACTTWSTAVIDPHNGVECSLAIGSDNMPIVSYVGASVVGNVVVRELRVAHCLDVGCSASNVFVLDAGGESRMPDLTIDPAGLPLISYHHGLSAATSQLRVARCVVPNCATATISIVDAGDVGRDPHLSIGGDGLALITYQDNVNGTLKVAHCADPVCSVVSKYTLPVNVEPSFYAGNDIVMTQRDDASLLGLVFFRENLPESDLMRLGKYACENESCK